MNDRPCYFVFEDRPHRFSGHIVQPGNPSWRVAIYQIVGTTEKRIRLKHAGGETKKLPHDAQGWQYVEKGDQVRAWQTDNLEAALAYRAKALAGWADECAARDAVTAPLFQEIKRLEGLIKDADAICDQTIPRVREAASIRRAPEMALSEWPDRQP